MGTKPVLLISVDCARSVLLVDRDIALVIISAGKMAILYIANKEDRASKNASYAQSFKIPSETMDIIRDHLTSLIIIIVICS